MCLYMGICRFVHEPLEAREVNICPGTRVTDRTVSCLMCILGPTSAEDKAVDQPAGVGALDLTASFRLRSSFCV